MPLDEAEKATQDDPGSRLCWGWGSSHTAPQLQDTGSRSEHLEVRLGGWAHTFPR